MEETEQFTSIAEVEGIIESIKQMQDCVLDIYKFKPIQSKKLLKDLESLKEEALILKETFLQNV